MSGKKTEFRRTGDLVWHALSAVFCVVAAVLAVAYLSGWWGALVTGCWAVVAVDKLGDLRDELNKPPGRYVIEIEERDRG